MKHKDFYTVKKELVDISLNVKDFNTEGSILDLTTGQYLYAGYYKPFVQMFLEFSQPDTSAALIVPQYYNGSAWVNLSVIDETYSFKKSGFIYFQRPTDWAEVMVGVDKQFFIRFEVTSEDLNPLTKLQGLNVLFSNDVDLEAVRSNIVSKHNSGASWVAKHEEARKMIIQRLRNNGKRKVKVTKENQNLVFAYDNVETLYYSNLTQFDFFEPFELREASKYYALSMVYLDELNDEVDDKWQAAGERHLKRAEEAVDVFMLRIDSDDDGEEDKEENESSPEIRLSWS